MDFLGAKKATPLGDKGMAKEIISFFVTFYTTCFLDFCSSVHASNFSRPGKLEILSA